MAKRTRAESPNPPRRTSRPGSGTKKKTAAPAVVAEPEVVAQELLLKLERLKFEEMFKHPDGRAALKADPAVHVAMVRIVADRIGKLRNDLAPPVFHLSGADLHDAAKRKVYWQYITLGDVENWPARPIAFIRKALRRPLPFTSSDLAFILGRIADFEMVCQESHRYLPPLLEQVRRYVDEHGVTAELAKSMDRLADAMDRETLVRTGNSGAAAQRRTILSLRQMAAIV